MRKILDPKICPGSPQDKMVRIQPVCWDGKQRQHICRESSHNNQRAWMDPLELARRCAFASFPPCFS